VIRKGIISPFLLLILIPQALKIGVDAVVRIPVLFVVKDEIYIKALPGVGGGLLDAWDRYKPTFLVYLRSVIMS